VPSVCYFQFVVYFPVLNVIARGTFSMKGIMEENKEATRGIYYISQGGLHDDKPENRCFQVKYLTVIGRVHSSRRG